MASVMYRLLDMEFPPGTLEEIVRLGLLAFCSHIFLQWPVARLPPQHLSAQFKNCLLRLTVPLAPQLCLWLLFTGDMSLFAEDDEIWLRPWQRAALKMCNVRSWSQARVSLKCFLWIDLLHDKIATGVFESVYVD